MSNNEIVELLSDLKKKTRDTVKELKKIFYLSSNFCLLF